MKPNENEPFIFFVSGFGWGVIFTVLMVIAMSS